MPEIQNILATSIPPAKPYEPDWYQVYFVALQESDRSKALVQIERAEEAIHNRVAELRDAHSSSTREMQDLKSAMTYLGILLQHIGSESGGLLWD